MRTHPGATNALLFAMIRLITILFCVLLCQSGTATVWNMPDATWPAASNYVATSSLQAGDTVNIPAGTYTWFNSMPNIYGVTLSGAGTNLTYIIDETPTNGNGLPLFSLTSHPTYPTRLTGFTLMGGVTNGESVDYPNPIAAAYRPIIAVYGTNGFRVDHCVFTNLTGKPIDTLNHNYGLVDHNVFWMLAGGNAMEVGGLDPNGSDYGDWSWATPYAYGSSNALYIEDNYFYSVFQFCSIDIANGGRVVIRHNDMEHGMFVYTHGTESGQRYRSSRVIEVYNNIINHSLTEFDNGSAAITIRGGTALIYGNTCSNWYTMISMQNYRTTDNSPYFLPWYGATGLSGYDSNSPALLNGVASSTSTNLVVSGASWTINQWYGCTVYNSNKNLCGIVYTNDATSMSFYSLTAGDIYQQNFTSGDTFVVHTVYPQLDQPGMGYGLLLEGPTPAQVWSLENPEPIHSWSNTWYLNGSTYSGGNASSAQPNIINGRDFTNAIMTGYTGFTYPNPLQNATNPPPAPSLSPVYNVQFIYNH